jgi:hypothetical protein
MILPCCAVVRYANPFMRCTQFGQGEVFKRLFHSSTSLGDSGPYDVCVVSIVDEAMM